MNGLLFCSFIWSLGILSIFPVPHPAWIGVVGFWHPCLTKWYINAACQLVSTQCDSEQTEHLEAFPLGVPGLWRYFFETSSSGVPSVPSRYYCVNVRLLMLWLASELMSLTSSQEQWILEQEGELPQLGHGVVGNQTELECLVIFSILLIPFIVS